MSGTLFVLAIMLAGFVVAAWYFVWLLLFAAVDPATGTPWSRGQRTAAVRALPRALARPAAVRAAPPAPKFDLGDDILIDITSRYNEAVVANIDAIDTALVAIIALPVAFAVFAVDKISDLADPWKVFAIVLLFVSGLAAAVGYAWGVFIRGGRHGIQDGMIPRRFLQDYATRGNSAVADAIRTVNSSGEVNSRIRRTKRNFAGIALVIFLVGAATVFAARVGSSKEPGKGGCPSAAATRFPTSR